MNGELAIDKDRASLWCRAQYTILQRGTKTRKIQKIFAKSNYCLIPLLFRQMNELN